MGVERLDNVAPVVHTTKSRRRMVGATELDRQLAAGVDEPVDAEEIFDYIRDINDPEHPYTLEQLNVVREELITVVDERNIWSHSGASDQRGTSYVNVSFTPTIPHCSMATLIGLAIYVKLRRSIDRAFKVLVHITPGSHATEEAINRQLADKERVAAAMENPNLMQTINQCLRPREYY